MFSISPINAISLELFCQAFDRFQIIQFINDFKYKINVAVGFVPDFSILPVRALVHNPILHPKRARFQFASVITHIIVGGQF